LRILFIEKQIDYEPQGIMSMSAVLKQAGHEVALAIANQEDPIEVARQFRPGIIGYSVLTGSQRYYFDLNLRVKQSLDYPVLSVFGGPHPTFFPEMIREPGVDGLCIGEGEFPMLDLANALEKGNLKPDIQNWWFKLDGEIVKNPPRGLIHDLSELPLPDRALIYDKHTVTRLSPVKHFLGSRGCPYNCTYCFNHAWYQIYKKEKRGYQRDVDHIIAEVRWTRERYPLDFAVFIDDLFIIFMDWLEEFADKWPTQVGLPFFCNVRANLLTPEKVALLKKAGCACVSMGIEAGNDRIRNDLLKRKMTKEQMIEAGRMIREAGIHLSATNILGLPTGTLEDDWETLHVNQAARVSYAHAFLFQPYPGTELGTFAFENDYMVGTYDDLTSIMWEASPLVWPTEMEQRQIENLARWFAITVEWPWLEPLVRQLIKLPRSRLVNTLYRLIYKLWKGYAIKTRIHPHKLGLKDLWRTVRHFMELDE